MSAEWEGKINAFSRKLTRNLSRIHAMSGQEIEKSIKFGSGLTGAPGQPVDTGYLRNSWISSFPAPMLWQIETNASYAPVVEEGGLVSRGRSGGFSGGTYRLRSEVGGFHSVKLTRTGFTRIVHHVAGKVLR
jgi:hypothetical protein